MYQSGSFLGSFTEQSNTIFTEFSYQDFFLCSLSFVDIAQYFYILDFKRNT